MDLQNDFSISPLRALLNGYQNIVNFFHQVFEVVVYTSSKLLFDHTIISPRTSELVVVAKSKIIVVPCVSRIIKLLHFYFVE